MASAEEKTHYELLGVERTATEEQIRTSYKEIARVFHPDSNFFSEIIVEPVSAEEINLFKMITAAYSTLIDRQKRAEYDQKLPPMLQDWDTRPEREEPLVFDPKNGAEFYRDLKRDHRLNRGAVFGNRARSFEESNIREEEIETVKSVAQMVQEQTILHRIKTIFGLR